MIGPKSPRMSKRDSQAGYRAVERRAAGACEYCGRAQAQQIHHRLHRSHGGGESPANLLHLCRPCHEWAHQATGRYESGVSVRSGFLPASAPVWRRGVLVWLTADGRAVPVDQEAPF